MTKIDEMAKAEAVRQWGGRSEGAMNRLICIGDFVAGARAVLEEARRIASGETMRLIDPMGRYDHLTREGSVVMLSDLEALFEEEDHEQR